MIHKDHHESYCHNSEAEHHGDCCSHEHNSHSHGYACCNDSHEHGEEEEMSWWKPVLSLALLLAGIAMSAMNLPWFQNQWVRLIWYAVASCVLMSRCRVSVLAQPSALV